MMQQKERRGLTIALIGCDAMMLLWATALALALRYGVLDWPGGREASTSGLMLLLLTPFLTLAFMHIAGLYRVDELFGGYREYAGVARSATFAAFVVLLLAFLGDVSLSRGARVLTWALSVFLLMGGRFAFRRGVFALRRSGRLARHAIIAGADGHAIAIARGLADPASGWRVVGFLDDFQRVGVEVVDGLRVLGDPSAARSIAQAVGASDIILVPHAVSWEAQRELLEAAAAQESPAVRLAPGLYHLLAAGARPMEANYVPLLSLERLRITGPDAALKTVMDYGLAIVALPALAGVCAAHWAAGKLCGERVLLSRQQALGRGNQPFDVLTFAAPQGTEPDGALRQHARRVQLTIASGRLSKLPNALNVLRGKMSFVGPRALSASSPLRERPWANTLLLVRPGLTGPNTAKDEPSAEEQALLDVAYVREYSLWSDVRLIFASVRRALRRERPLPASYQDLRVEQVEQAA